MEPQFRNIGIIGRVGNDLVIESVKALKSFLLARNLTVVLEEEVARVLPNHNLQVSSRKLIGEICDLVIVVGGDGSMLGAARELARHGVPVLGVNRGGLGFLTDISPAEIEEKIDEVLSGDYIVERRFLLDTVVKRDGEPIGQGSAFNDVVVSSGEIARMIEFETYIEGQFVYSQRSDGLIVSTPTGSTAYSLSGGGPIMHPKLDALALVPMFPHTLSSRPIVVDGNSEIKIVIGSDNQINPIISCDGHLSIKAQPGDVVYIYKKPHKLKMIHPTDHNFYGVCRDKLGWGNKLVN
ncbi:NAD kinase [BD1-7 clade bacterium]|uniref:NAD kinase n=1 Tax=BD1-7 clade bacterium TaxID=2029982 RepID=A0A5S9QN29_9GAMM|nr:NAD kinase [BD1-7 clade bacterium]CAA0096399.1 NAD kinase [BD1-7 clade bacterium]CAA0108947.1 NAD kinase [BD1-7 clade bacterium]CAA0115736.1 NAD kinase [BD1-7 clade bacterium]CAA0119425.1 NAD kinase [BD1-7 clade bacterium]